VCDITNNASCRELHELYAQVHENCQSTPNPPDRSPNSYTHDAVIPIVVVINKVDLESAYDGLAAGLSDQYKGRVFRTRDVNLQKPLRPWTDFGTEEERRRAKASCF
jgi:hypothetical protein